jgi:hypothetical protein
LRRRIAHNRVHRFDALRFVEQILLHQARPTEDRAQRRPQLVRDHAEEFIFLSAL